MNIAVKILIGNVIGLVVYLGIETVWSMGKGYILGLFKVRGNDYANWLIEDFRESKWLFDRAMVRTADNVVSYYQKEKEL